MKEEVVHIGRSGRLVIPATFRRELGMEPGAEVILRKEEDGIRLYTRRTAISRAQAEVRRYVPEGSRLAAELIAERRREAQRE